MNHTPANLTVSEHEGQSGSSSLQGTKDHGSLVSSSPPQPTHILKFTDTLLTFDPLSLFSVGTYHFKESFVIKYLSLWTSKIY